MKTAVVYRHKYLSMAEMVQNLLRGEGVPATVQARDPFGAFSRGPHLARYQPTPCSVYEVRVPAERAAEAGELVGGIVQDGGEERGGECPNAS